MHNKITKQSQTKQNPLLMTHIKSSIVPNNHNKFYEVEMSEITIHKMTIYAELFNMDMRTYFLLHDPEKPTVPGRFILSMFPESVARLKKKYCDEFPIKYVHNMEFSVTATVTNPIFVNDELIFRLQPWSVSKYKRGETLINCIIEILRGEEIVFKGTFDLLEQKVKD